MTSRSYSFVELTSVPFVQARLNCVPSFSSLPVCMIIAKTTSLVPECSASPDNTAWCNASAALAAQVGINCFKVCRVVQAFGLFQAWDTVTRAYQAYPPADFTQKLVGLRLYGEDASFVSSR